VKHIDPALTTRLDVPRLPADLLATAAQLPTATLHEAGQKIGALPSAIRPLAPGMRLCGQALTVHSPPGAPSAASRSMRSWYRGVMKTMRPVSPMGKCGSPVTSDFTLRWAAPQQSPGGMDFPCGQVGGGPRSVQTESVASAERMCSNSQAWFSATPSDRSRRSRNSRSAAAAGFSRG